MSENTEGEPKNSEHRQNKAYYRKQNYNSYDNGGKYRNSGRHRPEDLREKLNRMRQERDTKVNKPPPPDPPNGFLKDPLRDGEQMNSKATKAEQNRTRVNLKQPVNIKVELSTTTGERSCVIDDTKKLPEIRHVPDKKNYYNKKHYNKTNDGHYSRQPKRGENQYHTKKKDVNTREQPNNSNKSNTNERNDKKDTDVKTKIDNNNKAEISSDRSKDTTENKEDNIKGDDENRTEKCDAKNTD